MKKILFFLFCLLILSLFLQNQFQNSITNPLSSDTDIRERLLMNKKLNKVDRNINFEDSLIDDSIVYSDLLVDLIVDSQENIKLLDYENHEKHNLSNKYNQSRVFFINDGTIKINNSDCDGVVIFDNSGKIIKDIGLKTKQYFLIKLTKGVKLFKAYDCKNEGSLIAKYLPTKLYKGNLEANEIGINIGSKEKELKRLIKLSNQKQGNIIRIAGSSIETTITANNKEYVANIKLSGRTEEHLTWFPSIDVKLVGGSSYHGMTAFKLYRLETKSGFNDIILMSLLKDLGFISPRVDIIKLNVDNNFEGYYYLMESPSNAFFVNNRRSDGNIVGLNNNKLMFNYPIGGILETNNYFNTKNKFHDYASEEVFLSGLNNRLDSQKVSSYVGFLSAFAAAHGLGVDDLRFYYNPISLKYEPIPRDLNPGMTLYIENLNQSVESNGQWVFGSAINTIYPGWEVNNNQEYSRSLSDYHFAISLYLSKKAGYKQTKEYLKYYLNNPIYFEKIKNRSLNLAKFIPELYKYKDETLLYLDKIKTYNSFFSNALLNIEKVIGKFELDNNDLLINRILPTNLSESFDESELRNILSLESAIKDQNENNATVVKELSSAQIFNPSESCLLNYLTFKGYQPINDESYYVLMLLRNSSLKDRSNAPVLFNRDNNLFLTPIIQNDIILNGPDKDCSSEADLFDDRYRSNERVTILKYKIDVNSVGFYRFYGKNITFDFPSFFYFLDPKSNKIESKSLNLVPSIFTENNNGFSLDNGGVYELSSGINIVDSNLYLKGTSTNPIVFKGKGDSNWDGLRLDCNGGNLHLENVIFKNYGKFPYTSHNGNFFTGGVSIYNCNALINNVKFINADSEDALNIINSKLNATNLSIENSKSDGVDLDFSHGTINNMVAKNIGGDALDISFSNIEFYNSNLVNVIDKGISVGENSVIDINNVLIANSDMGIAVKDQSYANINDTLLKDNRLGIATYIKKPYFGKPIVNTSNIRFENNENNENWLGFRPE
jgi:hypothetical protein